MHISRLRDFCCYFVPFPIFLVYREDNIELYWECNSLMNHLCLWLVAQSVGRSVNHNFHRRIKKRYDLLRNILFPQWPLILPLTTLHTKPAVFPTVLRSYDVSYNLCLLSLQFFGRGFPKDWGMSQIKEFLEASCGGPLQVKVAVIDRAMPDQASVKHYIWRDVPRWQAM